MQSGISTILPSETHSESEDRVNYEIDQCIDRYNFIRNEPEAYASYELDQAIERIGFKYFPHNSETQNQPVKREIMTRIHEDSTISALYPVLDSLSFQDIDQPTLLTVFAHNLNPETLAELKRVSARSGGCIRVAEYNNPNVRGAYYGWQRAMKEVKGDSVALVDSDGYALPDWSKTMFEKLESDSNLVGVSGSRINVNGGMYFQTYSKAIQTLRPHLPRNVERSFRAGNSVMRKSAAQKFAYDNAGRLREDGFFAGAYSGRIAYIDRPYMINDASKFAKHGIKDTLHYGATAIANKTARTINSQKLRNVVSHDTGVGFLTYQVARYAPWTKPLIEKYNSEEHTVKYEDLEPYLAQFAPKLGYNLEDARRVFNEIFPKGTETTPGKFVEYLDEIGARIFGPIIRG